MVKQGNVTARSTSKQLGMDPSVLDRTTVLASPEPASIYDHFCFDC